MKQIRSNLKRLLDDREMSIRKLEKLSRERLGENGIKFETLRRMYHDEIRRYDQNMLCEVCDILDVRIEELLILEDKKEDKHGES